MYSRDANNSENKRHIYIQQSNEDVKGKVFPVTCLEDPECGQRYNSTLSLNLALDGMGGQRHAPAVLLRECVGTNYRGKGVFGPKGR